MFDSTKANLKDLLRKADEGKIQLPDFQRDYVWSDEDVKSLIASVAKGFPVGALLTLETGGSVSFKPRLLEGVERKGVMPEELLLDGQQRLTSLYQATYSKAPVRTSTNRNTEIERYYYLDMKKSVGAGADIGEAIIGVPGNKILRSNFGKTIELDVSTPEAEYEHNMFPLNQVFDSMGWLFGWQNSCNMHGRETGNLHEVFFHKVIEQITHYEMPLIRLDKSNSREAICLVFEKVNVGGKKLDAFELVTAIYAADEFKLREDWAGRLARMIDSPNRRDVLTNTASTDFLQACTLLHTRDLRLAKVTEGFVGIELPQISCRKDAMLGLPLQAYKNHADSVEAGFVEASKFLNEQNIIWNKDVPYPPQIVALASTFAILGQRWLNFEAKKKLVQWFWSVTFGELYGSSTDSRIARDVPELVEWITGGGSRPRSVDEAIFQSDRLLTLRSRASAAYKGLHALMMNHGCRDFITGSATDVMTFFDDQIDIHHIFPRKWCIEQGISYRLFNSTINKTPLSKRSNIIIGGHAPSIYLRRIEEEQGISSQQLDSLLRTHLIEPEHLRCDDFRAFFQARHKALATLVGDAMGKPVIEDRGVNEEEIEFTPESNGEWTEEN